MAGQIQQNPDGSYSKTHSAVEISLITALKKQQDDRLAADQELWLVTTSLGNRVKALEDGDYSLADMQNLIVNNSLKNEEQDKRIKYLEESVIVDAYNKEATDQLAIEWKIEQIAHTFDIPTNKMFDSANLEDIRVGYKHYHKANITEVHDNHIPENTMQRYTIWAYASKPKESAFHINYADRLVVVANDEVKATYIDTGGNFGQMAKLLTLSLKEGWTKIQFLLANETQAGGLIIQSDLFKTADYLSCLDYSAGMITGNRIQAGSLEERHFSPNMDLVVHTLHATATDVPGLIVGNPEEQGILQIADGTISKAKDEPFVFSDGIRVNGFIRVTQLLIDRDFVRAGDGMIVKTIKDEYGYTTMYEIINDVRVVNGGGMHITGNAQSGYAVTNDLQIKVHPTGGLEVEGDPIHGYLLTNTMKLDGLGGVEITGDPRSGYHIRNTMKLTSDYGIIKVEGNAWEGYTLRNILEIKAGGGISIEGAVNSGVVTIVNNMSLKEDGGILISGDAVNGYTVKNNMGLFAGGGISISGDAVRGYTVKNDMLLRAGNNISISGNASSGYTVTANIPTPHVTDVTGSGMILVTGSGDHKVSLDTNAFNDAVDSRIEAAISAGVGDDGADGGDGEDAETITLSNPYSMAVVAPVPNAGMDRDCYILPDEPAFTATKDNSTKGEIAAILTGVIPPGADCVHVLTQGGWVGSPATVEIILELRILDEFAPGRKIVINWSRYISTPINRSAVDGQFPAYTPQIHTAKFDVRDTTRHYDVTVRLKRISGSGHALGRAREIYTGRSRVRPTHTIEDSVPREFVN